MGVMFSGPPVLSSIREDKVVGNVQLIPYPRRLQQIKRQEWESILCPNASTGSQDQLTTPKLPHLYYSAYLRPQALTHLMFKSIGKGHIIGRLLRFSPLKLKP